MKSLWGGRVVNTVASRCTHKNSLPTHQQQPRPTIYKLYKTTLGTSGNYLSLVFKLEEKADHNLMAARVKSLERGESRFRHSAEPINAQVNV